MTIVQSGIPRPGRLRRRLLVGMALYAMALVQAIVWAVEGRLVSGVAMGALVLLTAGAVARSKTWREPPGTPD